MSHFNQVWRNLYMGDRNAPLEGFWHGHRYRTTFIDMGDGLHGFEEPSWLGSSLRICAHIEDGRMDHEDTVRSVASKAATFLDRGKLVLVTCGAGLNRSGVVVGRTLINHGFSPEEAMQMVRNARGVYALSNPHFNQWLMKEGPSLQSDLASQEASDE